MLSRDISRATVSSVAPDKTTDHPKQNEPINPETETFPVGTCADWTVGPVAFELMFRLFM